MKDIFHWLKRPYRLVTTRLLVFLLTQNSLIILKITIVIRGRWNQIYGYWRSWEWTLFIYPTTLRFFSETNPAATVDLHGLDSVLEGASRPGHFRGVVEVVYALLDHINPTHLFLGLKDFQQVLIIKNMIHDLGLPVSVVACETRREGNGLAMSSRNLRLSPSQQEDAAVLYRVLRNFKNKQALHSPKHLVSEGIEEISRASLAVDYLAVVDAKTLNALDSFGPSAIACVAATCHGVRLIDNLPLWDD